MSQQIDQIQAYIPSSLSSEQLAYIDNIIIGTPFNDSLASTALNDIVIALAGDDLITGSIGNDIIVGGDGNDTVDYSDLDQAVTLKASGFVNKGKAGTDQILEIETIIGAIGQANAIDGSTSTSTTISLDVNLSFNSLVVNGVPGLLDPLEFQIQNFVNVTGTSQDDRIIGNSTDNLLIGGEGNDTIFGLYGNDTVRGGAGNDVIGGGKGRNKDLLLISGVTEDGIDTLQGDSANDKPGKDTLSVVKIFRLSDGNDTLQGDSGNDTLIGGTGNDTLDGGTEVDTADYSNLHDPITLQAVGVVNKGRSGTDQLVNVEQIIGATGKANAIDGFTGTSPTVSFDVDLSANSLIVNGIPGLGTLNFGVQNFVNVTGTSQGDSIIGNSADNLLIGGKGNDKISGLDGNDTIIGVDSASVQPGINEIDSLTGGAGADKLVLGDQTNAYYLGGGGFFGTNDYANITDFQTGEDQIQLKKSDNYIFGKNYIAVADNVTGIDLDKSQLTTTFDELIKNNGIYNASSLDVATKNTTDSITSSVIFPSFDLVAIVSNYSLSDISFV